jgi:hypothetical protein
MYRSYQKHRNEEEGRIVAFVTEVRSGDEMIFGTVDVMEIDVVAEELTAHWMVAELVMYQRCANDMTKCVATAVMRISGSSGRSHDTVRSMARSASLKLEEWRRREVAPRRLPNRAHHLSFQRPSFPC